LAIQPLLIIAGAGTGKTNTLAHRVGPPHRHRRQSLPHPPFSLSRAGVGRNAQTCRIDSRLHRRHESRPGGNGGPIWGGTFHATANRLLRIYGRQVGLAKISPSPIGRTPEDLLNDVRGEIGLDAGDVRFPRKGTALAIYSRCVNASEPVELVLKSHFPWCASYPDQLKKLFSAYTPTQAGTGGSRL